MSFASISIIGHVGQDPETRQAGKADVCTVSVAVNRKRGNEEFTDWYRCISFYEGNIKLLEDYVHKGSKIFIQGQPAQQKWEDRDGVERLTMEILIDKIQLLDPPPTSGGGRGDDRGRGRDDDRGRGRADAPRGRDDDRGGARRDDRRDDRGRGETGTRASARDERGRDEPRGRDDRGRDDDRGRGGRDAAPSRSAGGGGRAPGWDLDDEIPFDKNWQ